GLPRRRLAALLAAFAWPVAALLHLSHPHPRRRLPHRLLPSTSHAASSQARHPSLLLPRRRGSAAVHPGPLRRSWHGARSTSTAVPDLAMAIATESRDNEEGCDQQQCGCDAPAGMHEDAVPV
ncbi:unnamed protein product, partial [Urochloa humidicola]